MFEAFQLPFFGTALIAILVLAGIHAYLGYHVVRRGVIFVDLALAQMAALGLALAIVLGIDHESILAYLLPVGMTFVGAATFAWLRRAEQHAPLEAFIGIVFATAQASVFLVLERTPAGPEHIKETLVGSLWTVDPKQVAAVAAAYAVIGLIHFLVRKPIFEITNDPAAARARGRNLFWWDFFFYGLFGLVVTSAVRIAGVLLVFGLLVIPAVAALLVTRGARGALVVGTLFAAMASVVGLIGSIQFDVPATPSILLALTAGLVLFGIARGAFHRMASRGAGSRRS